MASKSAQFFENGTNKQFEFVLSKYQDALQAKADSKNSKSEILIKLDKWYQNELPKKIKSRGKEAHLTHEEIVQTIKWKLARGQFRPRLKDLIQMNTPRVVMQETKKAFRAIAKKNDLEAAVSALSNLKGVGPAMASAVLAAGAPEIAPFMADELLLSMPEVEGIDYTMKEYMKLVEKTNECVSRLNAQGGSWNPHKVELAVWAYYIARDLKPELLDGMPDSRGNVAPVAEPASPANEDAEQRVNGENGVNGEVSKENGNEKPSTPEVESQTNGIAEVDESQKSVHSLSPEPEAEPVGFSSEPVPFSTQPEGYNNCNGISSASDSEARESSEPAKLSTEELSKPEIDEKQFNGESTKEAPLMENGSSYPTYNYNAHAPSYSDPTTTYSAPAYSTPSPFQASEAPKHAPVEDNIPKPTAPHEAAPVFAKRPLEDTEEVAPEIKRVREDAILTPEPSVASSLQDTSSHISQELPVGGVVPAPTQVTECPAPNGVNSAPPQPILTGGGD